MEQFDKDISTFKVEDFDNEMKKLITQQRQIKQLLKQNEKQIQDVFNLYLEKRKTCKTILTLVEKQVEWNRY